LERLFNDNMDIILIGGFSELFELCEECNYNIIGYVDNRQFIEELSFYPYKYLGNDDSFPFTKFSEEAGYIISPDNPLDRERLASDKRLLKRCGAAEGFLAEVQSGSYRPQGLHIRRAGV